MGRYAEKSALPSLATVFIAKEGPVGSEGETRGPSIELGHAKQYFVGCFSNQEGRQLLLRGGEAIAVRGVSGMHVPELGNMVKHGKTRGSPPSYR